MQQNQSNRNLTNKEKSDIASAGYDLIVNRSYSITKASAQLGVSRTTLRKYMSMYIVEPNMKAKLELAISQPKIAKPESSDIVSEAKSLESQKQCESVSSNETFADAAKNAADELPVASKKRKSFWRSLFKKG